MSLRLGSLEKRIGRVERAAGLGPCAMCELCEAYMREVSALIAEVAATKPAESGDDLKAYTSRSFCAWCGREETREYKASGDTARDLDTIWRGLDEGRACAPEFVAALDCNDARLREWFGPRAADYEATYNEFMAEARTLPPPRFPYSCAVAGCRCKHPKRAAA